MAGVIKPRSRQVREMTLQRREIAIFKELNAMTIVQGHTDQDYVPLSRKYMESYDASK